MDWLPALSSFATGSRVICNPPVLNTDDDWLVLVENLDEANDALQHAGWSPCAPTEERGVSSHEGEHDEENGCWRFTAWRAGAVNVIVTADRAFYLRSCAATLLAKHLNLLDKGDRVSLFRAVKFGNDYEGVLP